MVENIFFYCLGHKIGGEQYLYIRCAKYLSLHTNYNIYYIDFEDGFAKAQLKDFNVRFIPSTPERRNDIQNNSCVIIALSYVDSINQLFAYNSSVRFILWSLQPFNLVGKVLIKGKYNILLPLTKKSFRNSVKHLVSDGTIQFMDYNNYYTLHKHFGLDMEKIAYLPVPIDDDFILPVSELKFIRLSEDVLSFMWLSRIDHDKKHTLMTLMNELDNVNKQFPCSLIVAGDGTALEEVQDFAKKLHFPVRFTGRLFGDELNRMIDSEVDVGIGMGTSSLEIAKRGKPVIMKTVLNKTYNSRIINDYIFLHQEYGYSLGSPDFYTEGQGTFIQKVNELVDNYSICAESDYNYVVSSHSLNTTGKMLIDIVEKSSNTVYDEQHKEILELTKLIKRTRNRTFRH